MGLKNILLLILVGYINNNLNMNIGLRRNYIHLLKVLFSCLLYYAVVKYLFMNPILFAVS